MNIYKSNLKFVLLIVLIHFGNCELMAQCPTPVNGVISFRTQDDIDNFAINYPNCTEIVGNVSVNPWPNDEVISNLNGFENLTKVVGNFVLGDMEDLTSLNGLHNITRVDGTIELNSIDNLTSLSGLENLQVVENWFYCRDLPNVHDFTGIEQLDSVGWFRIANVGITSFNGLSEFHPNINTTIAFSDLDELVSFEGLEHFTEVNDLYIGHNTNLTSLEGLHNITMAQQSITIIGNSALTAINLHNLTTTGSLKIEGNNALLSLPGLQNLTTIEDAFRIINTKLINLTGLDNLTTIGGKMLAEDNENLVNFEGLENLTMIGELLQVGHNNSLASFSGLNNLTNIGTHFLPFDNPVLESFEGLENLTTIENNFQMGGTELINFTGLDNLTTIGGDFRVNQNENIVNFEGLESLTTIVGILQIEDNNSITSTIGLNNLTNVGNQIRIDNNPVLESFEGLENLRNVRYMLIWYNDILSDISSLSNISFLESIRIQHNPLLSICSFPAVCNYLVDWEVSNFPPIHSNASGCFTVSEVLNNCADNGSIHYPIFYDENENMLLDIGEPLLSVGQFTVNPGNLVVVGNHITGGFKYLNWGNYTAEYESLDSNWILTSPNPFSIALDSINPKDTIMIGLFPSELVSDVATNFANNIIRCNEFTTFDVIAVNDGTTLVDGILWFEIDPRVIDTLFIDTPDYLETNRVGWDIENLLPSHNLTKQIKLQIPGPPAIDIGDSLSFTSEVIFSDAVGQDQTVLNSQAIVVQCAYDPNDKLVQPSYPDNYALFDEDLTYTVRFQNTGNAEAYNVSVEDVLDANLDISTFRVIGSSHQEVLNTYIEGSQVTFEFRNIFLPDSTTNFDASQGYVMYSISPMPDIEEFTIVENTADIYFDFNPAIITNTTQNNIVYSFDHDEDESLIWDDCDDYNASVYPGAIEIPNNNIDEDCDGEDLSTSVLAIKENQIRVYPNPFESSIILEQTKVTQLTYEIVDVTGQIFHTGNFEKDQKVIPLNFLADGIYIIKIMNQANYFTMKKIVKFSGH